MPTLKTQPISFYARELRPELPVHLFEPIPSRLLWLALYLPIVVAGITGVWAVADWEQGWLLQLLLSFPIGMAFAGLAFVAHETLHGAIVRGAALRRFVGWVGFMPFLISPRHWVGWHNKLHHGNTMHAGVDPDSYPTLEHYRSKLAVRVADRLSFGGGRLFGVVSLLIGLLVQSSEVLLGSGPRADYLPRRQHTLALLETAAALAVWVGLGVWLGGSVLVFGWLVPLVFGSVVVMAHILTNHSLSAMTETNDPLENSLTVTVPRWFSLMTLQFGMHVEHHMFPAMSGRHAPRVRALLQARYGERYRSMPLGSALRRMFGTGRVYENATTLLDPLTGSRSPTL